MAKKPTPGKSDKAAPAGGDAMHDPSKPYVVLARKYRPATFDDLIGQSAMVTTLRNAFQSGRIAQGYMLTGVRGVGKTTTARIMARALNYQTDEIDRPTIDMPTLGIHCKDIMEGRHPDVFEMDAASNTGIDNIREIIENAQYAPIIARTKVFIIDEVHMLSKGAFNALLKTLEEPPADVRFIFATTEIRKVPVTVLSRCQRFDLRRVEQPVLVEHFRRIAEAEGAKAADDALALIARAAEGSVRDGLSILDQAIAMGEGNVTASSIRDMLGLADRARIFDIAEQVFQGDVASALAMIDALHGDGAEPLQVINDLAEAIHVVARIKAVGEEPAGEALSVEEKARASALAGQLSMSYLSRAWQMLLKGIDEVARAPSPKTAADMVLIRLAYTADLPTPDELIRTLGGETISARRAPAGQGDSVGSDRGRTLNVSDAATTATADNENDDDFSFSDADSDFGADDDADGGAHDDLSVPMDFDAPSAGLPAKHVTVSAGVPDPRSFAEVVALVGQKRDVQLQIHLEDHVSLVRFDAAAGAIDLFLLDGAPPEIANQLREKLNAWTGRRWLVVLSKSAGAPSIGSVKRAQAAAERREVENHPAVRAVMEAFPEARIVGVRKKPQLRGADSATDANADHDDDEESQAG